MHVAELADIHFPDHTVDGYYPLENGNSLVTEEHLVFDALCFMRSYLESGLPAPNVVVGIGKGGLQDMQRYAYLLGTKNVRGKSNVRVLTAQTIKYNEDDEPLEEIEVAHAPSTKDLEGAEVTLVCDDMIDEGGSLDTVFGVVDQNAPEGSIVLRGTAVVKQRPDARGILRVAAHCDVAGRIIGGKWLQLINQFESFEQYYAAMREMNMKYPNWREEVACLRAENVLPKLFPHLVREQKTYALS